MNQFFYESRGKEKIKDLMEEGMMSQAFHKSHPAHRFAFSLSKLAMLLLGMMIILSLFGH